MAVFGGFTGTGGVLIAVYLFIYVVHHLGLRDLNVQIVMLLLLSMICFSCFTTCLIFSRYELWIIKIIRGNKFFKIFNMKCSKYHPESVFHPVSYLKREHLNTFYLSHALIFH